MKLINNTQHNVTQLVLMDQTGAETLLIVVKATWSIGKGGRLWVADEQMPIISEPVYLGEPGKSSLIYDTDIVLQKPGTDCALIGHAWALESRIPYVDVIFNVGPVKKQARVFGERRWVKNGIGAASISRISSVEKIALIWENAFGGIDTSWHDPSCHDYCLENPVGRGFMAAKSNINIDGLLLPNIEDVTDLIQKPEQHPMPAGFGMIAPYWQPRAKYAGTFDDNWRMNFNPLLPDDFDPRFNLSAAPGLHSFEYLTGSEQVFVEGASRQGCLRFDLPGIKPQAVVRCRQREEGVAMMLDTVIVEPDGARLVMVWRGTLNVHGMVQDILSVRVDC